MQAGFVSQADTEHRFLSVLFCDFVDSAGHQYRMEPEAFARLLSTYRRLAFDAIGRHGGHVARVLGDGVLAYFGWPRGGGRDAEAAVTCALAIGESMRRLTEESALSGHGTVAVRMAVETGWVLVGNVSAAGEATDALERGDVVGHAPNVAARLQHLARHNGVVVGEATLSLLGERFELEPVDTEGLALPAPVRAARVVRRSLATEALQRLGAGRDNLLVGRDRELDLLLERWRDVQAGRGQMVLLSGEPGIGKSSLAATLIAAVQVRAEQVVQARTEQVVQARTDPVVQARTDPVVQARADQIEADVIVLTCSAAMMDTALQPLAEPLRLAMGLAPGAGAAEIAEESARLARRLGLTVGGDGLAAVLGVAPPWMAPAELRSTTFQATLEVAERMAMVRPLLVLAEDLQWADPSTLELLRQLGERLPAQRIMLVATHHADWSPDWAEAPHVHRLLLSPLTPAAAAMLLEAIVGGLDIRLRAAIVERSEGIPFFVREFARALGSEGPDLPGRGSHTASRLPGSISQLLAARLDSAGSARGLVQDASVIGRDVDAAFLARLSGLAPVELGRQLDRLIELGILQRRGEGAELRYGFRHSLLAAASYEALTSPRRQALHRRVADALEAHDPGIGASEPEVLGRHRALAGEAEAATGLFNAAAATALLSAAFMESATHARRSLELAANLAGEARQRAVLRATVLLGEALSGTLGYASNEVHGLFETANRIALELGGAADLQPALRGLTAFYQLRGPMHRAYELGRRTVQVARMNGEVLPLAEAERRWGWCRFCQGEMEEARLLVESAMNRIEKFQASRSGAPLIDDNTVRGPVVLGLVAWFVDGDAAAMTLAQRVGELAENFPRPMTSIYGLGFASVIEQLCGRPEIAHRRATLCGEIARSRSNAYWASLSDVVRGWCEVMAGGGGPAMALLHRSVQAYADGQNLIMYPYTLLLRADAERLLGAPFAALETLREAMDCIEATGIDAYRSLVEAARGRILIHHDPDAAAAAIARARAACLRQGALAQLRRLEGPAKPPEPQGAAAFVRGAAGGTLDP